MPIYSKEELDEFEENVLKGAWAYQKSKGKMTGNYPTNKKASEIHKLLFGGPPTSSIRRDMLKALDKRLEDKRTGYIDYTAVFLHGPNRYEFSVDTVKSEGEARRIAIGKYIKANNYGHNSPTLVNTLIKQGIIELEISPAR